MAERVVQPLEAVEIDEEQRHAAARAAIFRHGGIEALAEQRAIGEVGEAVVMRHVPDALGLALLVGHVLGDADQILRLLLVVADDDHARAQEAQSVMRRVDRLLLDDLDMPRFQHLAVARDELIGFLLGENVVIGLADDGLAGDAEELLACPVQQDEAKVARVLDEDDGRNVLDDGFEKLPSAEQRAQILAGFRVRSAAAGVSVAPSGGSAETALRCIDLPSHPPITMAEVD